MAAFAVILSRVPLGGMYASTSSSKITGSSCYSVVLAASLGRGSGGVHGYRAGKGRRRRSPGNESSDEAEKQDNKLQCKNNADSLPSENSVKSGNSGHGKRFRKRSSKLKEEDWVPSSSLEEVAPVAGTILTAPELFETNSQESSGAPEVLETTSHDSSSVATTEHQQQTEADDTSVHNTHTQDSIQTAAAEETEVESEPENPGVVEQMKQVVAQVGHKVVDDVLPEQVVQVAQAVEQAVEQAAFPVVEKVATAAAQVSEQVAQVGEQVASMLSVEQKDEDPSDDEFEAYTTSDRPEFRGVRGLENFAVLQENYGVMSNIYDFYIYILKKPTLEFSLAMLSAPVVVSMFFTLLYLPQIQGLAFGEAASYFGHSSGEGLRLSWETTFQVFMFSVSLSTGLQPELAPVSPYTLVVANINALVAQLLFVFLSGAVFARLSQPSQPIRCSSVALVSPPQAKRGQTSSKFRVFMARYVLVGPQPCELVDVKVDLSYKYNTITRTGTYFRATQSLKLIRSEVAYLTHGMLVRHIIDESSPLNRRTPEMLKKEDGIFTLSVVGLERSSMQSVFHAQNYSMDDDQVIWNAEYEDMILISKKNRRIVDHSRLSQWRPV